MSGLPFIAYIILVAVLRSLFRIFYGSRRYRKYSFERFRQMLYNFHAQFGGSIDEWTNWVEYRLHDGLRVRATYRGRSLLKIFLPHTFTQNIYLYRIPPFVYSLLKPALPRLSRLDHLPYIVNGKADQHLDERQVFRPILERLCNSGYSIQINSKGMTLTKTLSPEDGRDIPFLETLRTIREFARLLDGPVIEIPVNEIPSAESRCAYCKEEMIVRSEITHCSSCGTPHHRECFDLNSGCSVFGCNSNRLEESPQRVQQLIQ